MMPTIYCADIGSIRGGRFGWAVSRPPDDVRTLAPGDDEKINALVAAVIADLRRGIKVALGFECPLFVPVPDDPMKLGCARGGEGSRPWSAGAGTGALATGLVQVSWVLREIQRAIPEVPAFLDWTDFSEAARGLFLWEAFVSGKAKAVTATNPHCADATVAVARFVELLPDPRNADTVTADQPLSLVGAAALWSGLICDTSVLATRCVVIKALEAPRAASSG